MSGKTAQFMWGEPIGSIGAFGSAQDVKVFAQYPDAQAFRPGIYAPPSPSKDTNPKDAVGTRKAPLSTVPAGPLFEIGLAMLEGARKYGRHNYRVAGIRASVYYDAAMRHLMAWWEGQDIDPDSGLPHLSKAMACLVVLRDAQLNCKCTDDRPPQMDDEDGLGLAELNTLAGEIIDRIPTAKEPYTR